MAEQIEKEIISERFGNMTDDYTLKGKQLIYIIYTMALTRTVMPSCVRMNFAYILETYYIQ